MFDIFDTCVQDRDGSGRLFLGPGGPRASIFWPGRASGQRFPASGLFGPPILAHFRPIFADFSAQSANYEVRARSGYPKFGPGRAGPTKKHGPRAEFRAGPRPDPSLHCGTCTLVRLLNFKRCIFKVFVKLNIQIMIELY